MDDILHILFATNYSATAVLSQEVQRESQHASAQSVHSVVHSSHAQQGASSAAFSELLQHAHEAAANIAAAIAIDINTFFIIRFILRVKHFGFRKLRYLIGKIKDK